MSKEEIKVYWKIQFNSKITAGENLLFVEEPVDVWFGETDDLTGQPNGKGHLNASITWSHRELWSHRTIGIASAQFIQLPAKVIINNHFNN